MALVLKRGALWNSFTLEGSPSAVSRLLETKTTDRNPLRTRSRTRNDPSTEKSVRARKRERESFETRSAHLSLCGMIQRQRVFECTL